MEVETTTIRVDRATVARLKTLAGETPVARYLRELTEGLLIDSEPTLADLILEIRSMGKALRLSEKRMKVLDLFLTKAAPSTLEVIKQDLEGKLAGEAPETWDEVSRNIVEGLIAQMNEEQRAAVLAKLTGQGQ